MGCEFQKDIKFDDIHVGDLVMVERFRENNGSFIGESRGIALRLEEGFVPGQQVWVFDGMVPVYSDMTKNFRMFRVTVMDAEYDRKNLERVITVAKNSESSDAHLLVAEIERVRKIEAGVKKMIEDRKNIVELVRGEAAEDEALGLVRTAGFHRDNAERLMSEIWPLEALLNE